MSSKKKISKKSKIVGLMKNYANHATIDGCIYISSKNESLIGKMFWILVVGSLMGLGFFW
jgi:hypothetical protein